MKRREAILYFCDEAGVGEKYAAVGGLAIRLRDALEIAPRLKAIRSLNESDREIKWSNAKKRRDNPHKLYATLLRQLHAEGRADFHINFIPMHRYQHRLSGRRGKIDTVSKQYFNLIFHRAVRFYGGTFLVHVRPDNGEFTEELPALAPVFNARAREFGFNRPVKTIERRNSQTAEFLQLLDVTLGAFTALRNNRYTERRFKAELADEIWRSWGAIDLSANTPLSECGFNVWNVSPSLQMDPQSS